MKVSKRPIVVLKGEMSGCLYKLVANVQMGGVARRASTSNSSRRQVVRRKLVMFVSTAEGGNDPSGSS